MDGGGFVGDVVEIFVGGWLGDLVGDLDCGGFVGDVLGYFVGD